MNVLATSLQISWAPTAGPSWQRNAFEAWWAATFATRRRPLYGRWAEIHQGGWWFSGGSHMSNIPCNHRPGWVLDDCSWIEGKQFGGIKKWFHDVMMSMGVPWPQPSFCDFRARFCAPSYDITNRQSFENTMQWIEAKLGLLWEVLEGQVESLSPWFTS